MTRDAISHGIGSIHHIDKKYEERKKYGKADGENDRELAKGYSLERITKRIYILGIVYKVGKRERGGIR